MTQDPEGAGRRRSVIALLTLIGAGVWLAGAVALRWRPDQDAIDAQEQQRRIDAFARAGPIRTPRVPDLEVTAALDAMPLAAADKARLRAQLAAGNARLVYVTLWDADAEDGDRVRLDSASFSFEVALTKRPTRVAVPEPAAGTLSVIGARDGDGGGITVAMQSGSTMVQLPVLSVGQFLGVPVSTVP